MPETLTIPKATSSFPAYLDWSLLRETGIKHIEKLGSDLWTDYNLHDPGITILEVLCYALTDLGYRTNFDIKDLLTRSHVEKNQEAKTIFGQPYDDNFFSAAEVLTCNPVTIDDFRRLLIDIPGVRNAWLEPAPEGEMAIYLNRKDKRLQFEIPKNGSEGLDRLCLRGLYDVCVELEPLLVRDACGAVFFSKEGILEKVYQKLCAHRNLCEDLREVIVFGEEQIFICADIELDSKANPEDILLNIYKQAEEFLSPTTRFYTLQEMLQKGKRVEDIFAGRPLTAESHGFIDPEDLKKLDPKSHLYASDLYRVIMDVEGVLAVRNLSLANAIDGVAMTKGEKWCLELTPKYRPHFDLDRSQLTFFKGMLPFNADKKTVQQRYLEEKAASVKTLLDPYQLNLPIPEGTHHELEDYRSILEEFPLTYGIGEAGIKGVPDIERKGQAKQLKGYLLFFDQLLANYLSQLAHVRDLFSMRPDEGRNGNVHTYFTHLLQEVPGIEHLVKNLHDCEGNDQDPLPPEDFPSYLQYIAESIETYQQRRNRFLDHLLARFSESFTDYVLLMFEINGKKQDEASIIQDKADFLSSFPDISRNRGKGYDYCLPPACNEAPCCGREDVLAEEKATQLANVSGLEKRVSKLIGIDAIGWRNLAHGDMKETTAGYGFSIAKDGVEVLKSKLVWETDEEACTALGKWHVYLCDEKYYRRLTYDVAGEKEYAVAILDDSKNTLAVGVTRYPSIARYCQSVDNSFDVLKDLPDEQFEVVETEADTFYVAKDGDGAVLIRFTAAGDPVEDFDLFKQSVKEKKYYCREDFTVLENNEYGFILVNEQEECIAESTRRYIDPEKREEVIHWLISQIKLPGMECEAVRETECYDFQLYNYTGETLLLQSAHGFQTANDAMLFFDTPESEEDFMGWAIEHDHYEKTENNGLHSFHLKNSEEETVALHPYEYETEQECDDRLQAIIYYLDDVPPVVGVEGVPGTFEFEITDAAGNVLFKSVHTYPTQMEANKAAWLVRTLARHRVYYHLLEDTESDLPFGFELLDRDGNPIAMHPQWYATDCERDLAVDVIIYCSENVDVQHQVTGKEDGFYFDLLDAESDLMMKGLIAYPDANAAETAWEAFMDRAAHKDNYQYTTDDEAEYPYGFELLNAEGEPMAASALSYATEAESQMALRAVLNYICHTEWHVEITGDPGIYHFWLDGTDGKRLLDSIETYPDEPTTKLALQNALQLARNVNNFYLLPNYTFELRDEEGSPVASHPHEYTSAAEQEAAINLIVNYVRDDAPRIEIPNVGGAFRAVIFGENGEVVFRGSAIHPNQESALAELEQLLQYAACPDNYQAIEDGDHRCRFGFNLLDNEGGVVAVHPMHYPSSTERDEVMLAIFAWLSSGEKLIDKVVNGGPKYRFVFKDFSSEILLQGVHEYDTVEKAQEDWNLVTQAVCDPANFSIIYDNANCAYSVKILVNGSSSAVPPRNFTSRTSANEWINLIALILKEQAVQGGAEGTDCGYYFVLNHSSEYTVELRGLLHYPSPSEALRACHGIAPLLQNEDYFQVVETEDKWQLIVLNESGELIAQSTADYEDETAANDDRGLILTALEGASSLTCENEELVATYFRDSAFHCQVKCADDVLLESIHGEMSTTFWRSSAMYHSRTARDLKMKEVINFFKNKFDTSRDIVEVGEGLWKIILQIKDLHFESEERFGSFGEALEIYQRMFELGQVKDNYRLLDQADNCLYSFELIDGEAKKRAWEHCSFIHELALLEERYSLITNEEECLYGFELTDKDGIPVASHPDYYATAQERDKVIKQVVKRVNCEGMHLVEHILLRPQRKGMEQSFGFELFDNELKITLLQSATNFETEEEAWAAFLQTWIALWHHGQGDLGYVQTVDDLDGLCKFSFEIINMEDDGEVPVLAVSAGPCHTAEDRDELLEKLVDIVRDLETEPTELPALPESYQAFVNPLRLSEELVGDRLMMPVLGHLLPDATPKTLQVDPYSFRATVVLPYWPARFQRPEFRAFLETTLRQQAPAHVFLRICWVDVCQMQAFERAYCKWMVTQAGGEDSCDAVVAKNDLLEILCRLRSIYPAASLHDCKQPSEDSNRVILNYSIIGSANSK